MPRDTSDQSPPPGAGGLCFRGRRTCRSFLITEAGLGLRLNPESGLNPSDGRMLTGELGVLWNRNTRLAWGAGVFANYGDRADGWGIRPRVRRWLSETTTLDVSAGVVRHVHIGGDWGFAGQAALGVGDWVALSLQTTTLRLVNAQRTGVAWYGGVRLGSYPGVAAGVVAGVVGILFAIACGGGACD